MFKLTNKVALVTGGSRPSLYRKSRPGPEVAENAPLTEVDRETVYASGPVAIPITRPINLPKTDQGAEYAKDNTRT